MLRWIPLATLLVIQVALLVISSRLQFPTRNEVAHVPAGLSYWHTGTFSLYNVNPPLWKMLATLPTLLFSPKVEGIKPPAYPGHRAEWAAAQQFADDNISNYFDIMWSARIVGIIWSVLGSIFIYRWANELYGRGSGLLSVAMWCFGPNILAHSPLATPDIPATVAGLAATYIFWRYLKSGDWLLAIVAGILLGIAQLTKFTMLALYIVWPVMSLAHIASRSCCISCRKMACQISAALALSVLLINLGYGFNGSFTLLGRYVFVSNLFTLDGAKNCADGKNAVANNLFHGNWLGDIPIPLPYDYLSGLDIQNRDLEGVNMPMSYLAGEWRNGGWWHYYIYGLGIKVPLGTWGLVLWGLMRTIQKIQLYDTASELTLWLPVIFVLILVSSQTGFNHHLRYVLPLTPFACVATGKVAVLIRPRQWKAMIFALVLLGWSIASSLSVYPHSLSYFNELAGGAEQGHKHMLGSNIDWGQDLFFFKKWADNHPDARPLSLSYYNCINIQFIGAEYGYVPLEPCQGWFAVDVWNLMSPDQGLDYFRQLRPVAKAGYSIFIYYISKEEADRLRNTYVRDLPIRR